MPAQGDPHQPVARRAGIRRRRLRRCRLLAAAPRHAGLHEERHQPVPRPARVHRRRLRRHELAAVLPAEGDPHQRVARGARVGRRRLRRLGPVAGRALDRQELVAGRARECHRRRRRRQLAAEAAADGARHERVALVVAHVAHRRRRRLGLVLGAERRPEVHQREPLLAGVHRRRRRRHTVGARTHLRAAPWRLQREPGLALRRARTRPHRPELRPHTLHHIADTRTRLTGRCLAPPHHR